MGTGAKDVWMIFFGASTADKGYSKVPLHDNRSWQQHAAGRILAVAHVCSIKSPQEAKKAFPRLRADTGAFSNCFSRLLHLPAFSIAGHLQSEGTKDAQAICTSGQAYDAQGTSRSVGAVQDLGTGRPGPMGHCSCCALVHALALQDKLVAPTCALEALPGRSLSIVAEDGPLLAEGRRIVKAAL